MAHLLRSNGAIEKVEPDKDGQFSLERLEELVGTATMTPKFTVPQTVAGVEYTQAVIDEEANFKQLPKNLRATVVWADAFGIPLDTINSDSVLSGDMLLVREDEVEA